MFLSGLEEEKGQPSGNYQIYHQIIRTKTKKECSPSFPQNIRVYSFTFIVFVQVHEHLPTLCDMEHVLFFLWLLGLTTSFGCLWLNLFYPAELMLLARALLLAFIWGSRHVSFFFIVTLWEEDRGVVFFEQNAYLRVYFKTCTVNFEWRFYFTQRESSTSWTFSDLLSSSK